MANIEATEARIATNVVRRSQLKFVAGLANLRRRHWTTVAGLTNTIASMTCGQIR